MGFDDATIKSFKTLNRNLSLFMKSPKQANPEFINSMIKELDLIIAKLSFLSHVLETALNEEEHIN